MTRTAADQKDIMRYQVVVLTVLLVMLFDARGVPAGAGQALPVRNGRPLVAVVGSDAIALDELVRAVGPTADRARLQQGRGTADEVALVERLVTIKLICQEAARMGLDELPEIQKQVEVTSREILREVLFERLVKDVKPDPAAVEKQFRELAREWKTTALLFQEEAAAVRAQKEIAGGAPFTEVAARAVAAKTARMDGDATYHSRKDYLPQIAEAVAPLQVGQVSPVVRLPTGFVVLRVLDIRYPENPEARAEARRTVLSHQQQAALATHGETLRRNHLVINKAVLNSIDYEAAKPGIDQLLKDKRVVAEIKGAAPVTVGDLTDYLRMQFFHGTDQARQRKEMNTKKTAALDATLDRRLLNMEALKLGIDKTDEYRDRVSGYRESLVFDAFVQRVIAPQSKLSEDEVRRYHSGHPREFAYPEMLRIRSLAFGQRGAAEDAMRKLREGADFGWLSANAGGQLDKTTPGLLTFDGRPVTTSSMPEGVQGALTGVRTGESRLYAGPGGHFYVLAVQEVIASKPRPYDEVREDLAKKLFSEKLSKGVADYAGKLRAQSKTETYLKRMQ